MAQVVCGTVGTTRRQKVRRALLLASFILFPLTMNYMSPYLIVQGSFEGILTGSAMLFASMFIGSMLLGRLWCGWVCPAAGIQEPLLSANPRRVGRIASTVKWAMWVVWLAAIGFGIYSAAGYRLIDPFYGTVGGISVAGAPDRPILFAYIIYLGVVFLLFALALLVGRRGGCHTVCWMAPFMISGRWLRNRLGAWPSLRLKASPDRCTRCGTCTAGCPMSIDVTSHVQSNAMEHPECILCGVCVDSCPQDAIRYSFSAGK